MQLLSHCDAINTHCHCHCTTVTVPAAHCTHCHCHCTRCSLYTLSLSLYPLLTVLAQIRRGLHQGRLRCLCSVGEPARAHCTMYSSLTDCVCAAVQTAKDQKVTESHAAISARAHTLKVFFMITLSTRPHTLTAVSPLALPVESSNRYSRVWSDSERRQIWSQMAKYHLPLQKDGGQPLMVSMSAH